MQSHLSLGIDLNYKPFLTVATNKIVKDWETRYTVPEENTFSYHQYSLQQDSVQLLKDLEKFNTGFFSPKKVNMSI